MESCVCVTKLDIKRPDYGCVGNTANDLHSICAFYFTGFKNMSGLGKLEVGSDRKLGA